MKYLRKLALPAVAVLGLALLAGCDSSAAASTSAKDKRLLILGMDGMDPGLVQEMMAAGRLPNFARLAAAGSFQALGTSMPPQSPVAWANFICGANPGTHQLYDFVHRDANPDRPGLAILPFLSSSRTGEQRLSRWARWLHLPRNLRIPRSDWRIPLSSGETELLRRGDAFWNHLVAHGIDTSVYRVPSNYPPPPAEGPGRWQCVSGMGTPDVLGTYGEFTLFTPKAPLGGRNVGGGRLVHLNMQNDHGTAMLEGPDNFLRKPDRRGRVPKLEIPVDITRDPVAKVAKVVIGDELLLLNEGEWSDWIRIEFPTGIPGAGALEFLQYPTSVRAIVRLHLKQVHPRLELYVSPLNIDPLDPAADITAPHDFSQQLARDCGLYYTTGIPEDAKALRTGALSEDELLQQVGLICKERTRQYYYALDRFERGCLFYYFGHTDQVSHLFWRDRDPEHPGRVPEQAERYGDVIEDVYIEMDQLLGRTLARLTDADTLIVLSDHGFAPFRRGFNVSTWLLQNGYLSVFAPANENTPLGLADIDWSRTRAYALGFNSIYVNLRGREKWGIVAPGQERTALLEEIARKLVEVRDDDGTQVIHRAYLVDEIYPDADPEVAPDLLVGYARGFRAGWDSVLGGIPPKLIEDNMDRWSGTHLICAELIPGILFTNRKVIVEDPTLMDVAPTILSVFGIEKPPGMIGRPLFGGG